MISNKKTKTPLLFCSDCKKYCFAFELKPSDTQLNILTSCTCRSQTTMMSLHQYLTTINNIQVDEVHQCYEHIAIEADKYCYNCNQWLCEGCIKIHISFANEHILIDYAVTRKCEQHNMPYTAYCQQCNKTICKMCSSRHIKHYMVQFILQDDHSNVFDNTITNLQHNVLNLIKRIDYHQSDKSTQMKNDIQCVYNVWRSTNKDLLLLYKSLWKTALVVNMDYLLDNIRINTKKYVTKELPIDEEYSRLRDYLKQYYVWKKTNVHTAIIIAHRKSVNCLVVLNNRTMASGSDDNTIKLWNTATNQCIATLTGHRKSVNCLVVLNDGILVSGSGDDTIKLWNPSTHQCIATLTGHSEVVNCLAVLNDGTLLSGSDDFTIKHWNTLTHQCITTVTGHSNDVKCLIELNDATLASGSEDNTIKLWKQLTYQYITTLTGHSKGVYCLVILKDGTLASASNDSTIKLWNTSTNQCITTLIGHSEGVNCLVVLNDGALASASNDSTIGLWKPLTHQCTTTIYGYTHDVICLVVLNDGTLASGSVDAFIILWDVEL